MITDGSKHMHNIIVFNTYWKSICTPKNVERGNVNLPAHLPILDSIFLVNLCQFNSWELYLVVFICIYLFLNDVEFF